MAAKSAEWIKQTPATIEHYPVGTRVRFADEAAIYQCGLYRGQAHKLADRDGVVVGDVATFGGRHLVIEVQEVGRKAVFRQSIAAQDGPRGMLVSVVVPDDVEVAA